MSRLKSCFTKMSADARPWAVWIWNLSVTRDEALSQLQGFAANGFGGVAIRIGRDLQPAFLSEEFMVIFGSVLEMAAEKGLGVRFYADFSRPWNTGVETLLERNADYRLRTLKVVSEHVLQTKELFEQEGVNNDTTMIFAVKMEGGQVTLTDSMVLKASASGQVSFRAPAGEWKVLVVEKQFSTDASGSSNINIFNSKAANAYVQNVLELFRARFSSHMAKTFKGFVTEMPFAAPADGVIPWDDDLVIKYRAKHKKELLKLLPALFCDVEPSACRNRSHLYHYLTQSMFERFSLVIETWAKKNHLSQWVLCAERPTYPSEKALKDFCFLPECELASVGAQNCDGLLESAAVLRATLDMNSNEFRRESISVIGRNRQGNAATVQELKSEFDVVSLGGVSRILIDGCFFSIDHRSQLKSPFNPGWYSPDVDKMKQLCDYITAGNEALAGVHYARSVAVLYPSSAVLADHTPSNDSVVEKASEQFDRVVEALQETHVGFDIVSEHLLLTCSVRVNGEFGTTDRIRKGNYGALVIPYGGLVSKSLLVFMEKLIAKKGTVIFVGDAPLGSLEEGVTKGFSDRVKKLLATKRARALAVPLEQFASVASTFESLIPMRVNGRPCPEIHVSTGSGEGYELYLFHNISGNQDYFVEIDFAGAKHLTLVDTEHQELHEIEAVGKTETGLSAHLNFAPLQTYIVAATQTRQAPPKTAKTVDHAINQYWTLPRGYRIVLKNQWQFRPLSPNALPLATWNNRIGLSRESGGFSHFYESTFFARVVPKNCYLVFNGVSSSVPEPGGLQKSVEITVNGAVRNLESAGGAFPASVPPINDLVVPTEPFSFYRNSLVADLSGVLVRGVNRVSVRTIGFISHPVCVEYPPVIAGDFAVKKDARGWVLDTVVQSFGYESWSKNGYPYFSGRGLFRHVFEVPSSFERLIMRFTRVTGSVAIGLNGKPVDGMLWQPMELDVTDLCGAKRNELQVVTSNTIDNVIRMNGRPSGILGEVYLDVY